MSLDPNAQRRRAALAVFSPVLGEDALMDALWLLHETMHGNSAREVIAAVDKVAARHGLDPQSCKKLYEQFFRALGQAEADLPLDPWPAMLALRPQAAAPVAAPRPVAPPPPAWSAGAPAWAPVSAALAAAATAAAPMPAPAVQPAAPSAAEPVPPAEPPRPAHVQVFDALMQAALGEVRQRHAASWADLRDSAVAGLDRSRLRGSARAQVREAWQQGGERWALDLDAAALGELVHQVYVALCETLGPVDADQVLTRAVKRAEQIPAARDYSPRQFL